ncbi:MAG: phosphoglycerate mutase, partial [Kiritimatiellaeota bacterium]|nr:phosphoglycerate mutase [Kiritimatiellota bacterium]
LHVEAIDEVSHAKDVALKIKAIEDVDARLVAPVMQACGEGVRYVVLPDHPVPVATGKHTRTPVPIAISGLSLAPDAVDRFDEIAAAHGRLGALFGQELMELLTR